jgi:hypothetical protein
MTKRRDEKMNRREKEILGALKPGKWHSVDAFSLDAIERLVQKGLAKTKMVGKNTFFRVNK